MSQDQSQAPRDVENRFGRQFRVFGFGLATDLPIEGGAVILSPNPAGGRPNIMARILPDEWSTFAEAMAIR